MKELFVDIRAVQAQAIQWPSDVTGKLQLEDYGGFLRRTSLWHGESRR